MTKLMQWLLGLSTFVAVWSMLLSGRITDTTSYRYHVWLLPVYFCVAFGVYAASVVLYRVFSFNNCEEAAQELKGQIVEARNDLKRRGFRFD
ncbi:dolichol-phosphate mannosyltransferase subunit 3-like [Ornithodoros turicata]|uniref:dolichol-phosphate mannosyltransferase subunit 3-like n=1 Tax=Ornithodoros turicata TaxID=34597 RepID=UPI00313A350D